MLRSVCRARSLEVEEKLLPSPGPVGGRAGERTGGRVSWAHYLLAQCLGPRPVQYFPILRVSVRWSQPMCGPAAALLRPKGRGVTRR